MYLPVAVNSFTGDKVRMRYIRSLVLSELLQMVQRLPENNGVDTNARL